MLNLTWFIIKEIVLLEIEYWLLIIQLIKLDQTNSKILYWSKMREKEYTKK